MSPRRSLTTPARIGGFVALATSLQLLFSTIAGAVANVWGPPASDLLFRVVVVTQFLSGLGGFVLAVGLLVVAGGMLASRRGLIAASFLAFGLVPVVVVLIAALGLDYLQFRTGIPATAVRDWDLTVGSAVLFAGASLPVFTLLGAAAYRWVPTNQRSRSEPTPLIVNRG